MHTTTRRYVLTIVVLGGILAPLPQSHTSTAQSDSRSGLRSDSIDSVPLASNSADNQRDKEDGHRLREGTTISNKLGRFQQSGGRATFVMKNGIELGGLPNLNLQRVVRMLKSVDEPEGIWWSVSGIITEFSGRNYILIKRAVYKSSALPTRTEKLEE